MNTTETVTWHSVDDEMPDDETTVMLWGPTLDEIEIGYYCDGSRWVSSGRRVARVTHWAHLPNGPQATIDLSKYKIRTCQTMHECCVCHGKISLGQRYYDGGCNRRAHVGHFPSNPQSDLPTTTQNIRPAEEGDW